MPNYTPVASTRVVEISNTVSLILCGEDDLDPITCPELVPAGWQASGEVLDFTIDGESVEAWFIEKERP